MYDKVYIGNAEDLTPQESVWPSVSGQHSWLRFGLGPATCWPKATRCVCVYMDGIRVTEAITLRIFISNQEPLLWHRCCTLNDDQYAQNWCKTFLKDWFGYFQNQGFSLIALKKFIFELFVNWWRSLNIRRPWEWCIKILINNNNNKVTLICCISQERSYFAVT